MGLVLANAGALLPFEIHSAKEARSK